VKQTCGTCDEQNDLPLCLLNAALCFSVDVETADLSETTTYDSEWPVTGTRTPRHSDPIVGNTSGRCALCDSASHIRSRYSCVRMPGSSRDKHSVRSS
jgi:hypothetical protein